MIRPATEWAPAAGPQGADPVTWAMLQDMLVEQQALAEAIGEAVSGLTEQQARLDRQLAATRELLGGSDRRRAGVQPGEPAGPAAGEGGPGAAPAAMVFCLGHFALHIGGQRIESWRSTTF